MAGRVTQLLLDEFADVLRSTFENNQFACAPFLDISKAFDSLRCKLRFNKLLNYAFRGTFYSLLLDVLSNRSQIVPISHVLSSNLLLKTGAPQVSVLSPQLFKIFINDLYLSVSNRSIF